MLKSRSGAQINLPRGHTYFSGKVISGIGFLQANISSPQKTMRSPSTSRQPNFDHQIRMKKNNIARLHGFTLIEILVVLVIIGVMLAGVVIKAFPDDRQILRQEADRLGLLLEQARDEAFISGRSIAWSIQNQTYAFSRLNAERQWVPIAGNQTLRMRTLPASIRLTALNINGVKVPVSERLIFSPSGLNTPFIAALELQGHRVHLLGDSAGRVQVKDEN